MSYIALRDFDSFKKGDLIPEDKVEDRLIRGRKIGLSDNSVEIKETKVELITEVVEPVIEETLLEDSSDVEVKITEEIIPEVEETKKSKK